MEGGCGAGLAVVAIAAVAVGWVRISCGFRVGFGAGVELRRLGIESRARGVVSAMVFIMIVVVVLRCYGPYSMGGFWTEEFPRRNC